MLAYFGKGYLDAVKKDVLTKVASAGLNPQVLNREFGEEAVAIARLLGIYT